MSGIEFKGTPGPWVAEPSEYATCVSKDGESIAAVWPQTLFGRTVLPMEANARLIAAAPDLLKALVELLSTIGVAIRSGDWLIDGACEPDLDIARAEAAIAKAVGHD